MNIATMNTGTDCDRLTTADLAIRNASIGAVVQIPSVRTISSNVMAVIVSHVCDTDTDLRRRLTRAPEGVADARLWQIANDLVRPLSRQPRVARRSQPNIRPRFAGAHAVGNEYRS